MTHPSPAPTPAPASKSGMADLTRQRLIRAALELFTTKGYHVTTTAQIAKKAGVAEGTIYKHFSSKQHLVNELYRAAQRWALRIVQETARDPEPGTARARLSAVAHALVEGAVQEAAIVKLGLLDQLSPVLDDESRKTERDFRTALERIIAEGKAQGSVRTGAVEVWSGVWLATLSHALAKIADGLWKPADASVRLVIEAAWRAISA
ncbi:MAG TPA: TetR/AcrR family transcriptional regulator [Gemmatimonadales bacterium]|nr:TetR/AcrR family transcriptional regulator [Gemmatimonadales bacterium]